MAEPPSRTERTVHVTARVPADLARAFERVAVSEDRSVSAELRRVMRRHVDTICGRESQVGRTDASAV
jgi:hypothetical protein